MLKNLRSKENTNKQKKGKSNNENNRFDSGVESFSLFDQNKTVVKLGVKKKENFMIFVHC